MSTEPLVPDTRVLAVANHVVHGYVGNTMAVLVMQSLGCEVAALNTVQFSNHVVYGKFNGTRTSAKEIRDIYEGLKQNQLADFDMMLSGFAPSADAVEAISAIGKDLKQQVSNKPGSFFWVVDPVMGDQGEMYVDKDVVPIYKAMMCDADLLLPNQFEIETLSGIKIGSPSDVAKAITKLHQDYHIPHIIVTSISFDESSPSLSVIGSSSRADYSARIFKIDIPSMDCFFSETGDLFAALTIVRLRETVLEAGLSKITSWLPPDHVQAIELPLATATEKVFSSMHKILEKTKAARDKSMKTATGKSETLDNDENEKNKIHLRETKASEVKLVQNLRDLREAEVLFKAEALRT